MTLRNRDAYILYQPNTPHPLMKLLCLDSRYEVLTIHCKTMLTRYTEVQHKVLLFLYFNSAMNRRILLCIRIPKGCNDRFITSLINEGTTLSMMCFPWYG